MIEEEKLSAGAVGQESPAASFAPGFSRHRWSRYGPLIVWAVLIFIGSSDLLAASHTSAFLLKPLHWLFPNASDSRLAMIHFLLRKAGHFTEYAILALLAARAFRTSVRELLRQRWFWLSLALVIVYALLDEFHQSFVPSRTASLYDSLIDTAGGMTALLVIRIRNQIAGRKYRFSANADITV